MKGAPSPVLPVADFDKARGELISEIKRAPTRRVDNMLTQINAFAERLRMHARVIDAAAKDLRRFRLKITSWWWTLPG